MGCPCLNATGSYGDENSFIAAPSIDAEKKIKRDKIMVFGLIGIGILGFLVVTKKIKLK